MNRSTRDHMLMGMAFVAKHRGTCSRMAVGAVIAIDGRVVSTGYNGAPRGLLHCSHGCTCKSFDESGKIIIRITEEHHEQGCPLINPCIIAVHAETNALIAAARHGVAVLGGELFTTMSPCLPCSALIVNAGIIRVVYQYLYRDTSGLSLLEEADVEIMPMGEDYE